MEVALDSTELFKNPHKLPLNLLHITFETAYRETRSRSNFMEPEQLEKVDPEKMYKLKTETVPALDKQWVFKSMPCYEYQKYFPEFPKEDNEVFLDKNVEYIDTLQTLLDCNFHMLWCNLLFLPGVSHSLAGFLLNHVHAHELPYLEDEYKVLYEVIRLKVVKVFQRLLKFRESETEYLDEGVVFGYLKTRKLLNTPIIVNLIQLYEKSHPDFVRHVLNLHYSQTNKKNYVKELTDFVDSSLMSLEMMGGNICGFEPGTVIVTIAVGPRPPYFDPYWIDEALAFLFEVFAAIRALLPLVPEALELAHDRGLPHRVTYLYDRAFPKLYYLMDCKQDIGFDWSRLETRIYEKLSFGRSEAVDCFQVFVEYFLGKLREFRGDADKQDAYAEKYLKLLTSAFEDDVFLSDYNHVYPIREQVDLVESLCPEIDRTRTDYLKTCLKNLTAIPKNTNVYEESLYKPDNPSQLSMLYNGPSKSVRPSEPSTSSKTPPPTPSSSKFAEREVRERIQSVQDAMPHLGDGYVLQCLEYFDYDVARVFTAIFDDNLPPHLKEIPFDTIIIPPEPEPEKPVLAYKGKKPGHEDALQLLNDKAPLEDIKELVIRKGNVVESYNSDDDEGEDEDYFPHRDKDEDDSDPFGIAGNPNHGARKPKQRNAGDVSESAESDESDVETNASSVRTRMNFCEDPAMARARWEARMSTKRSGNKNRDLVGKPKGQGQEKSVLNNRDNKNTNKSSRANHNRKQGAQFKRSRGMMPM